MTNRIPSAPFLTPEQHEAWAVRLRSEAIRAHGDDYAKGHGDGRSWAAAKATVREIDILAVAVLPGNLLHADTKTTELSFPQRFFLALHPDIDSRQLLLVGPQRQCDEFCRKMVPADLKIESSDQYLRGFIDGAVVVWKEFTSVL